MEEIIQRVRRIGAEDAVRLEDQQVFGGREDVAVEMRVCEHLADGLAVLERVVGGEVEELEFSAGFEARYQR